MSMSVQIDTTRFQDMLDDLSREIKVAEYDDILRNEVRSILSKSIALTKKASKAQIKQTIKRNAAKKKKNDWYRPDGIHPRRRNWRVTDAQWQAYKSGAYRKLIERKIKDMQQRAGLSAQAWIDIAEDLMLQVKSPAYVRKATVKGSPVTHKVSGNRKQQGPRQVSYVLTYNNPAGRYANARGALSKAINGRTSYFRNNLRNGVFDTAKDIAAKYPGINVKRN